jgi:hypothetical protein
VDTVWGLLYAVQRGDAPIRFIKASILFGTLLTLITELLSVMTRLNAPFIQLSWGIVLVCLLVVCRAMEGMVMGAHPVGYALQLKRCYWAESLSLCC